MKDMKKRLNLTCWNCHETFELTLDITNQPLFSRECSHCNAQCIIDLNPYRQPISEVLRGREIDLEKEKLILPEQIPTIKPNEEESS